MKFGLGSAQRELVSGVCVCIKACLHTQAYGQVERERETGRGEGGSVSF